MPTPAAIAGLVVGAVLGASLLSLGAYTVHRYMDWRCRELVELFQRNTVRVVKVEDLECNKSGGPGNAEEQGCQTTTMKQALQQPQGHQKTVESQGMIGLRGGFAHGNLGNSLSRRDARQMQPYVPRPGHDYAHPTARRQELGWHQSGDRYDHLWPPPPALQQVVPQAGYYAYITPQPVAYEQPHLGHPSSNNGLGGRSEKHRAHIREAQVNMEPVSFEGDSIVVVDEYPSITEEMIHVKGKKRRKKRNKCKGAESRQSSSTELGTCSSDRCLTTTEDMPQDRNPSSTLRRANPPLRGSTSLREQAQDMTCDEANINPYRPHAPRRRRHEREAGGSVRSVSVWIPKFDGRRQAGSSSGAEPCLGRRGPRAIYEAVTESGIQEIAFERGNAFVDPRFNDNKGGPVVKGGASQAPCTKGKSAVQNGPPRSALTTRITNRRILRDQTEQPASDTATVGKIEETCPQPGVVVTEPMPEILSVRSPFQSPSRTPDTSSDKDRPQGTLPPVSPIDEIMTRARWDRSARSETERDRSGSISTEASFHKDDRK